MTDSIQSLSQIRQQIQTGEQVRKLYDRIYDLLEGEKTDLLDLPPNGLGVEDVNDLLRNFRECLIEGMKRLVAAEKEQYDLLMGALDVQW